MEDLFLRASRTKLRFQVIGVGNITTEDLWNLPLLQLDSLAIHLEEELGKTTKSFIKKRTSSNTLLELKFEIVKFIITTKMEEIDKATKAAEKRQKREQILELISKKQNEALEGKPVEELMKELAELDVD